MYFTFPVIYYGFENRAGVKSSSGKKEEKYPTKKSILPKMLGLSPIPTGES